MLQVNTSPVVNQGDALFHVAFWIAVRSTWTGARLCPALNVWEAMEGLFPDARLPLPRP